MKRLMFAALAATALSAPVLAEDSIADMRQPAIDKCIASMASGPEAASAVETCTCLVDGIIAAIPGEDGVKIMKLMVADPKDDAEAGAAMGVSAEEAKAFMDKHQEAISTAALACMKK
jgi:hypothetical protein